MKMKKLLLLLTIFAAIASSQLILSTLNDLNVREATAYLQAVDDDNPPSFLLDAAAEDSSLELSV